MNKAILPLMSTKELMHFVGERVRRKRRLMNISRRELAEKSGVSVATIGRVEREGIGTIQVLMKLAVALDASPSLGSLFEIPTPRTVEDLKKLEELE